MQLWGQSGLCKYSAVYVLGISLESREPDEWALPQRWTRYDHKTMIDIH